MANVTWQQHSFAAGQIDRGLMGRQDLDWYGSSCSTLENMTVAKQGYVSKRAGTNLVASLKNLLGTSVPIEKIRMIAVESKLDEGYYLIFANQKGYVVSDAGILLKDGTYTREIEDDEENHTKDSGDSGDGAAVDETAGKVPFSFAVPWRNEDLDDVKFCQNGDTIFTAHNGYPPGKIFNDNGSFSYSVVEFSARKWKRPIITECKKSGVDGGGGLNTISYVCTYVKDGVESEPSVPYTVSYTAPWKQGGVISVVCGKGSNLEDPDYFNVYKKQSTDYGLIASVDFSAKIYTTGDFIGATDIAGDTAFGLPPDRKSFVCSSSFDIIPDSVIDYIKTRLKTENKSEGPLLGIWTNGGLLFNNGVYQLSFGVGSGEVITSFSLALDAYKSINDNGYNGLFMDHTATGKYFECEITCRETASGKIKVFSVADNISAFSVSSGHSYESGTHRILLVPNYLYYNPDAAWVELYNKIVTVINPLNRSISFDFGSVLGDYFKTGTSSEIHFGVEKIVVKSYKSRNNKTLVPFASRGIVLYNKLGFKNVINDEYYAPDYTYTPPVIEPKFDREGDYPSCVALYKQRLVYASSKKDPFTIWMSCVGDLYNFNTHASIREDDALEVTLEAQRFPRINYLAQIGQGLMAFTDGGEFFIAPNSGNALSYKTVSSRQESSIGVANYIFPIRVGSEIVFIEGNQRTMRALQYNYTSDNHDSVDLSVRDQEMFADRRIVEMCYKQHPNSELVCVLEDGSIAEISYMKEQQLYSWSRQVLGGGWFAVGCASNSARHNGTTDVNLLVARPKADGSGVEWAIWKVRDTRDTAVLAERVTMDGLRVVDAAAEIASDERAVDLGDGTKAVGHPFRSLLVTVYPEAQDIGSTMQIRLKNARTVRARVVDAETFYVVPECLRKDERNWSIVETGTKAEGGALELVSGDFTVTPTGTSSEDGRLAVIHEGVLPFRLLYLAADFDFHPTIGQRGRG